MSKESSGGFLSKVVQLVRGPGSAWSDSDHPGAPLTEKQALKAAIERKRRNDFVRKREFDMLRAIRKREQQNGQNAVARPSFFQSSVPTESDGREQTIKKIDAIEAQMSTHWWQPMPGDEPVRDGQRLQAPPVRPNPQGEGAAHLQAQLFNTRQPWGSTLDGVTTSPPRTQPAAETQWPTPGASGDSGRSHPSHGLPVTFGDETTRSPTLDAASTGGSGDAWHLADCLQVDGVEEAAVRFANGDDAGAERFLGQAVAHAGTGAVAADLRALLLDFFRAVGRRDAYEWHAAEWHRLHGDALHPWQAIGETDRAASPQTSSDAAAGTQAAPTDSGPAVWVCPEALDAVAVQRLATEWADANGSPLVMDWRLLRAADPTAAAQLLDLFETWVNHEGTLLWVGAANLRRSLRASTPSGRRENNTVWWQLRLACLRLLGRADEFDLAALDYCVTYGVTPPDWALPLCQMQQLEDVPANAHTLQQHPGSASPATGRLTGALQGDVTRSLQAIAQPGTGQGLVAVDCSAVTRTDFVAAGALLQWVVALKNGGRAVELRDVHALLAAFFHIVGIADVAKVLPPPR